MRAWLVVLMVLFATTAGAEPVSVGVEEDAEADWVAVSVMGNASAGGLALSGLGRGSGEPQCDGYDSCSGWGPSLGASLLGDADGPMALSGGGDARGGNAVSVLGAAHCRASGCVAVAPTGNARCEAWDCIAASGTGNASQAGFCQGPDKDGNSSCRASGWAISGTGDARAGGTAWSLAGSSYEYCDGYETCGGCTDDASCGRQRYWLPDPERVGYCGELRCVDAALFEDADGGVVSVSLFGNASGGAVAASGTGDASGGNFAASGTGDATSGCTAFGRVEQVCGAAASGTGDAGGNGTACTTHWNGRSYGEGWGVYRKCERTTDVAVSGTGNATGRVAVSGTGEANECRLTGYSSCRSGIVSVSGTGSCTGQVNCVDINIFEDADGGALAVSVFGDAKGDTAVSVFGDSTSTCATDTGPAPHGDPDRHWAPCMAVSGAGDAEGDGNSCRHQDNGRSPYDRYRYQSWKQCERSTDYAVSGTGNATGRTAISATGEARECRTTGYDACRNGVRSFSLLGSCSGQRHCLDAKIFEDAEGEHAVSVFGNATSTCTGGADSPMRYEPDDLCTAASGTGDARGTGEQCFWDDDYSTGTGHGHWHCEDSTFLAVSGTGDAAGNYAISGTGSADSCTPTGYDHCYRAGVTFSGRDTLDDAGLWAPLAEVLCQGFGLCL